MLPNPSRTSSSSHSSVTSGSQGRGKLSYHLLARRCLLRPMSCSSQESIDAFAPLLLRAEFNCRWLKKYIYPQTHRNRGDCRKTVNLSRRAGQPLLMQSGWMLAGGDEVRGRGNQETVPKVIGAWTILQAPSMGALELGFHRICRPGRCP